MLRNAKSLEGYELHARDGAIGKVKDVYFDDAQWQVRYLVVSAGSWLTGREVLIGAAALIAREWEKRALTVDLTKEQVRNSPAVATDRPVSRKQERELHNFYAWPYYWTAPMMGIGFAPLSPPLFGDASGSTGVGVTTPVEVKSDPNLRSAHAIRGYRIEATDGSIGHVEDFLIDDESWRVPYLLVDTRNWWPGKKIIVSPAQIRNMDWVNSVVNLALTRDAIKSGPEFDEAQAVTKDYTDRLETHYGRVSAITRSDSKATAARAK